ncbi:exo-beta-N-acetylmuramidase NamZ domain-containing protein [Muribaculum intestinale]|uniref:exo-beta-N-acetylmuramidase NamZ domain-containing protein n=1 Tax=Muribaculum intestinale TaxID=1796646 RepID=UPI00241DB2F2|nr:exo-beta-N-acetylmuramidase NamZ domain-containing protein [Muribaculum intestinale]
MSRDLFSRYIWLIDTIKRYGALTREQINQLWIRSSFSGISDADALNTGFDPAYVIDAYSHMQRGADKFFSRFFDKLAGNASIRRMILLGTPADKIRDSWADEVYRFKQLRHKYLLYPEK